MGIFVRTWMRLATRMVHTVALPNGNTMPIIGLGTWQSTPEQIEDAVTTALDIGYRQIDTAYSYNNEEAIGKAIKRWLADGKTTREQLFIVTKLPVFGNRASDVTTYLNASLKRLQLTYVDLYLIHMPFGFMKNETGESVQIGPDGSMVIDFKTDHVSLWKAFEEHVDDGTAKAIGLSNFNVEQLERLMSSARIKPSNIQVELHAYLQQKELRDRCAKYGIPVTAFSSLGTPGAKAMMVDKFKLSPDRFPDLLNHPLVMDLAKEYKKTTAQILLRHLVQNGIVVIPKSINLERIKKNFEIFDFDLSANAMKKLDDLDQGEKGRIMDFRFFKGIEKHDEYPFKKDIELKYKSINK